MPSTFPTVKAYLVGKYQEAPDLAGVQVDYGMPKGDPEHRHVFLGGTGETGQEWADVSATEKQEDYGIQFWVYVGSPGLTQQEATEGAHALFAAVETVTRAELRNASAIATAPAFVWNLSASQTGVIEYVLKEGRGCLISGEIRVSARI